MSVQNMVIPCKTVAKLFDSFTQFVQYFYLAADRKQQVTSYLTSLWGKIGPDMHVKFHDLRLNRSREILPEAVGGGIFDGFFSR